MPRTLETVAAELVAELVRRTEAHVEWLFAEALERELELRRECREEETRHGETA